MDLETLRNLAEQNDVTIADHGNYRRVPPHYFDSLRNAFEFYFNTFNTQNASYNFYAEGLSMHPTRATKHDFLDEENTVLAIVAFERFFELFLKNLLWMTNENLAYTRKKGKLPIDKLIAEIKAGTFEPLAMDGKPFTIPFRETLTRFYGLIDLHKQGSSDAIVTAFSVILSKHSFLDSSDHQASLELLNWYRDRILHNGNKLPSLWMLDYFVTQHLIPIIAEIIRAEKDTLAESMFYFTTLTHIDLIKELTSIRFEFNQLHDPQKTQETLQTLLSIGHLKELGRANLNMNLYMRNNTQATYEYNYKDPKGRGRRFANVEKNEHPHAIRVSQCICCGEESMVVYRETINDIFNPGSKKHIEWVKCYTCDYHIRYNAGDPYLFNLKEDKLFS